jgi:hypothetical protein
MAIYDFSLSTLIEQITPKYYAFASNLSWQNSLLKPIDWLKNITFEYYAKGLSRSLWSNATAYIPTNIVRFEEGLFECIKANTGELLTNSEYWVKIVDDRIGVNTRIKFSSHKKIFEYALNQRFYSSGIYINNVTDSNPFFVGVANSSTIGLTNSSLNIPLTDTYNLLDFTIFVPVAIFTGLGANAEKIIRQQADKINMAGMIYSVQTY